MTRLLPFLLVILFSFSGCKQGGGGGSSKPPSNELSPEAAAQMLKQFSGSEKISWDDFQAYQNQGRLKVLTTDDTEKDGYVGGAQMGYDALEISDYANRSDLDVDLMAKDNQVSDDPARQFTNGDGETQTVLLMDNSVRIHSVAATIRSAQHGRQMSQSRSLSNARDGTPPSIDPPKDCSGTTGVQGPNLLSSITWPLKPFTHCIRYQSLRGTCSAFATASAAESAVALKYQRWVSLSPQALYNASKMFWDAGGTFTEGFHTEGIMIQSQTNGYRIPFWDAWNYNSAIWRTQMKKGFNRSCQAYSEFCSDTSHQGKLVCADQSPTISQCAFMTQVKDSGIGVQITDYDQLWNFQNRDASIQNAIAHLSAGFPIVAEISVYSNFLTPYQGYLTMPTSSDKADGTHAVHLVGYISPDTISKIPTLPAALRASGAGYFILKNSWGTGWGDKGYVLVPEAYIRQYTWSIIAIKDVDLRD